MIKLLMHIQIIYMEFVPEGESYSKVVQDLRSSWTALAGDFLPLAVAKMFQVNLTIFTTKKDQPIINFSPNMGIQTSSPIKGQSPGYNLTYLAVPGHGHYDLSVPFHESTASFSKKSTKPKEKQHVSPTNETFMENQSEKIEVIQDDKESTKPTEKQHLSPTNE
ncbi:unnamed protein product, partial [Owenia fusiformis]